MQEKWKNLRIDVTFTAGLAVLLGVLFVVWPGQITIFFSRILAAAVMIAGAVLFLGRITARPVSLWSVIGSGILFLVGLWLFVSPTIIASIIPIVIGVFLLVHGIQDVVMAAELRQYEAPRWKVAAVLGAISILFGVVCICNAFGIAKLTMVLIGLMLIYDGVTDMLIVSRVHRAEKNVLDADILHEEDVED